MRGPFMHKNFEPVKKPTLTSSRNRAAPNGAQSGFICMENVPFVVLSSFDMEMRERKGKHQGTKEKSVEGYLTLHHGVYLRFSHGQGHERNKDQEA